MRRGTSVTNKDFWHAKNSIYAFVINISSLSLQFAVVEIVGFFKIYKLFCLIHPLLLSITV